MKVLLTGATGYIGKRLLPVLVEQGHQVVCMVRDRARFQVPPSLAPSVEVIEGDVLKPETLGNIPPDIGGAYYLIHAMASTSQHFDELEARAATHFRQAMAATAVNHVVYLGGIANAPKLSKHLASRKYTEDILAGGPYHFTALRAGIIAGSGSASFEIMRGLVEKLPVMVAPKWLHTRCQPIAIRDVLQYLARSLGNPATYDQAFDIGGPEVLTYKAMLERFAAVRGLKRRILVVPVLTPRLSSYWLYFVTPTSLNIAMSLVDSMKVEVVCRPNQLHEALGIRRTDYGLALRLAFGKIKDSAVISSWKDSVVSSGFSPRMADFVEVPEEGCFQDRQAVPTANPAETLRRVWAIGGRTGWYYAGWLWTIRGLLDQLAGGVGLRRGRTHPSHIETGDAIDFWRVILADRDGGRLLLYAEMKLPGEAWLEFKLAGGNLHQTATFRPRGIAGRAYWYALVIFHLFIFRNMARRIAV